MTATVKEAFEALEWHDAVLLSVTIDRTAPGARDDVVLEVKWDDDRKQSIRFAECYALDARMNFGVTAEESIRAAQCLSDSPELTAIRRRWAAIGVALEDLLCFEVTTNSTNSVVKVFARRCEMNAP